jgi:C-terminal processing protease CtpA/Prc
MKDKIPIGTEIIRINGIDTKEYGDKYVKPYIASSTEYVLQKNVSAFLLQSLKGTHYKLELKKPDGSIFNLEITLNDSDDEPWYPAFDEWKLFEFKWINKEIAYIALNSFADDRIVSMFYEKLPEIRKAKKLIIDLRKNGGGSTGNGNQILQYLTYDRELRGSAYQSRLHIPAYKAWGKYMTAKDTINKDEETKKWNRQALLTYQDRYFHKFPYRPTKINLKKDDRIVVPTAILMQNNTASAAEDFLIAADKQLHMIKIGERSYGSTGQPLVLDLPGGGFARICAKKDTYPDGREFVGVGIAPDIFVKKTLNDFINNTDPILAKAIEYLKNI